MKKELMKGYRNDWLGEEIKLRKAIAIRALLAGQLSGFMTAVLPGIGASTAALIGSQIAKLKDHGFMILLGSVNTVNFMLSIATLYAIEKARNGAIIAIKTFMDELTVNETILFLSSALIAGCISVFLALFIGRKFSSIITKVSYKILVITIIFFIFILTLILTKFIGIVILITATSIGLIPPLKKVRRINLMGCLLLPVIVYLLF